MDSWMETDLYELIGASKSASTNEIKKAYRKKALSCHPDKNPNNPKAAELFHELSRALEILIDTSARAAYDKVINAKYQAKLRVKELDAKRKKLKEDLEAREDAYRRSSYSKDNIKNDKAKLQAEIERLQREGSKQVEEEIALMKKQMKERSKAFCEGSEVNGGSYKIKIKWKSDQNHLNNGGYNYDTLYQILSKYGDIVALIISSTKTGRALVEYQNKNDAEMALKMETGLRRNPLKLQKLWDTSKQTNSSTKETSSDITNFMNTEANKNMSDAEFEHIVLNNLRRAEEKKRSLGKLNEGEGT